MIRIQAWAAGATVPEQLEPGAFRLDDCQRYRTVWVDISGDDEQLHRDYLADVLELPKLAIDDAMRLRHPPKFETLVNGWNFILLRGLDADTVDINFRTIQLSFFWRENLLVTRHARPSASIRGVDQLLAVEAPPTPAAGTLMYLIMRTMADRYLPIVLDLETRLETIEELLITDPSDLLLQELMEYSRQLKKLRRIANYHEVTFRRMLAADARQDWNLHSELTDLHEHAERLASLSNLQYEITTDLINGYLSVASHRLNNVMRVLTVVTVLFVPLTFIAGIYGMNFEYIPELGFRAGYFVVWGVMVTIAVTLLLVFRNKRWI